MYVLCVCIYTHIYVRQEQHRLAERSTREVRKAHRIGAQKDGSKGIRQSRHRQNLKSETEELSKEVQCTCDLRPVQIFA